jgi:hypothetical protein
MLTAALGHAGLKTQAALAERMAQLEGVDTVPRGVVYRVFRQQPVDLTTLIRVAQALGVEVHTLLLSSDEAAADVDAPDPSPLAPDGSRPWIVRPLAFGAMLVILAFAIALWLTSRKGESPLEDAPVALNGERADLSGLAFAVLPFRGESSGLADAFRAALADHARVAPGGVLDVDAGGDDAAAIAARFGAAWWWTAG